MNFKAIVQVGSMFWTDVNVDIKRMRTSKVFFNLRVPTLFKFTSARFLWSDIMVKM